MPTTHWMSDWVILKIFKLKEPLWSPRPSMDNHCIWANHWTTKQIQVPCLNQCRETPPNWFVPSTTGCRLHKHTKLLSSCKLGWTFSIVRPSSGDGSELSTLKTKRLRKWLETVRTLPFPSQFYKNTRVKPKTHLFWWHPYLNPNRTTA